MTKSKSVLTVEGQHALSKLVVGYGSFFRRRADDGVAPNATRPPQAAIKPGSPAPAMGPVPRATRGAFLYRRLRIRLRSSETTLRRRGASSRSFGSFSAIPWSCSRRFISVHTSSGWMLEATHSTTRL